jgi:hypothetical protein
MTRLPSEQRFVSDPILQFLLEPLADYISASDDPRLTVLNAVRILLTQLDDIHNVATVHLTTRRRAD